MSRDWNKDYYMIQSSKEYLFLKEILMEISKSHIKNGLSGEEADIILLAIDKKAMKNLYRKIKEDRGDNNE